MDNGTPIDVLQLPESLKNALRELGHHTVESAFIAATMAPEPMKPYIEAHLIPCGMRFGNFIAECSLHLTAAWLKWYAERKHA